MEEKLSQIAKNTKPKSSFLITLTGQGSKLEKTFEPEISVKPGCHYEIAFTSLETYYSIPNINESNNTFEVSQSGTRNWVTITLQKGCYGLMDLNAEVQRQLEDLNMPGAIQFKANYNTFKCVMIIKATFGVNFSKRYSLRTVLGFAPKKYKAIGRTT